MSTVLTTTIDITATPDQVWAVLTDFSSYGEWSNFSSIEEVAVQGTRLTMRMPGMSFKSTVTAASPNQKLEWSAKITRDGLFPGQHTFPLARNDDGTTQLANTETFSGVSVRPFQRLLADNYKDNGYAAFNRGLKTRVETRVSPGPVRDA